MTYQQAQHELIKELREIYEQREAANIAHWVMDNITGLKKTDRLIHKEQPFSPQQEMQYQQALIELMDHKPVQYVLQQAWFRGMEFYVDERVLIPRPETEELVEWILGDWHQPAVAPRILDIGTGSGCIAIALKKALPGADLFACDSSAGALEVARKNAGKQQVLIEWRELNFLRAEETDMLPEFDIIASNPPYISLAEKDSINENVVRYEPWPALFVQDADPLVFYRAIARFGREKLRQGGAIYLEIHEEKAIEVQMLFEQEKYREISIRKDMQGKDRMCRVSL